MNKTLAVLVLALAAGVAFAADSMPAPAKNPYLDPASGPAPWFTPVPGASGGYFVQQALPPPRRDYEMSRLLSPEEKQRLMKMAMPMMSNMMQLDAREAMNLFATKVRAKPGLGYEEVVESMLLRANKLNLKHVGTNKMWLDFRAVLGDDKAPRIEVFSFCDIAVGRMMLKLMPEMIVFLPCRIAVMEDADRNIWLLATDWDVYWLDSAGKAMGLTPELRAAAVDMKNRMDDVMKAAASGDL